ncbi:MAG: hypothetical protein EZS28_006393 [Streblomastix strix]|uniref:Uncharacterized protein n=1 Tax=Streblomastix strix TaxID=222440 RepID=A0A5J4WT18_9EUKA|nr:MAG: hypothetical protein EZS28_006389 [Streblomastix strix]KAA6398084.1 MAG: hypothetical protein EZS28_006393 [Streblomastix strix]
MLTQKPQSLTCVFAQAVQDIEHQKTRVVEQRDEWQVPVHPQPLENGRRELNFHTELQTWCVEIGRRSRRPCQLQEAVPSCSSQLTELTDGTGSETFLHWDPCFDDCRKLHRKDVNNFSNHVVCVTATRNAYRFVVEKLERDELLIEVFERQFEDNIKTDIQKIEFGPVPSPLNPIIKFGVSQTPVKILTFEFPVAKKNLIRDHKVIFHVSLLGTEVIVCYSGYDMDAVFSSRTVDTFPPSPFVEGSFQFWGHNQY